MAARLIGLRCSISPWRHCTSVLHLCATRRLRLLNWRQGVRVALLRGGLERPAVVALSDAISPANPNEPTQAHLALTGKDG